MENFIYICGTVTGVVVANYIYHICQVFGIRFFLSRFFHENKYTETNYTLVSPLRIIFFWLTKTPYPFSISLPPLTKQSRIFTALALLSGPTGLFLFAFLLYAMEQWFLYTIPFINGVVSISLQISILTACISLLPLPPLDGSRILLSLFSPRQGRFVLRYKHFFPILILVLWLVDVVFQLGYLHAMLSLTIDLVLFLFQLGITP